MLAASGDHFPLKTPEVVAISAESYAGNIYNILG